MIQRFTSHDEEDPRYTEFLEGASTASVIAKVFVTQGVSQLIVSAPIQLAAASSLPRTGVRRWLAPIGIGVAVSGAVIEAVADKQKADYQQVPRDERAPVLDTGLWKWSRHPNYFGDSLMWDGIWLTAAASKPAGWTVLAPVAMNYFLIFATGAKRTEKRMQQRPAYRDYQRRVAFFFPWPPRG